MFDLKSKVLIGAMLGTLSACMSPPTMPLLERPTVDREVTILGGVGHPLVIFFEGFPEAGEENAPRLSTREIFKDGYNGGLPVDPTWDLGGVRRICVYQKADPNNFDCAMGPFNPTGPHNSVATLKL